MRGVQDLPPSQHQFLDVTKCFSFFFSTATSHCSCQVVARPPDGSLNEQTFSVFTLASKQNFPLFIACKNSKNCWMQLVHNIYYCNRSLTIFWSVKKQIPCPIIPRVCGNLCCTISLASSKVDTAQKRFLDSFDIMKICCRRQLTKMHSRFPMEEEQSSWPCLPHQHIVVHINLAI